MLDLRRVPLLRNSSVHKKQHTQTDGANGTAMGKKAAALYAKTKFAWQQIAIGATATASLRLDIASRCTECGHLLL